MNEDITLHDATTVATSYDLDEIKYELKRRYCVNNNIRCTLYNVSEETLNMALSIYDNPEIKLERDVIRSTNID